MSLEYVALEEKLISHRTACGVSWLVGEAERLHSFRGEEEQVSIVWDLVEGTVKLEILGCAGSAVPTDPSGADDFLEIIHVMGYRWHPNIECAKVRYGYDCSAQQR